MPQEKQKINLTLTNYQNRKAFLDDIPIVIKDSPEFYKDTLRAVLQKLDGENLATSLNK